MPAITPSPNNPSSRFTATSLILLTSLLLSKDSKKSDTHVQSKMALYQRKDERWDEGLSCGGALRGEEGMAIELRGWESGFFLLDGAFYVLYCGRHISCLGT
jgi:hypothetical protein